MKEHWTKLVPGKLYRAAYTLAGTYVGDGSLETYDRILHSTSRDFNYDSDGILEDDTVLMYVGVAEDITNKHGAAYATGISRDLGLGLRACAMMYYHVFLNPQGKKFGRWFDTQEVSLVFGMYRKWFEPVDQTSSP